MRHIYITTCSEQGGICHCLFEDGKMEFCEMLPLDRAMYTVIREDSFYTLIRDMGNTDGFGGFVQGRFDAEGKMIENTSPISTQGIVPCHLCVADKDVYVVNYLSGNLVKLPEQVAVQEGKSIHPSRQEGPHTHFVTLSPDGRYVLCVDLGLDTIFVYDRELNLVSKANVPEGSGCRHLCFSHKGDYVYCVNELSSDVSVFSYEEGVLTLLETYVALPNYCGENTAAAIRRRGDFLYVSHRGADCISTFRIEGKKLTLLGNAPCGGTSPRDFDVVDDYIICANEGGTVGILKLENGIPSLVDSYMVVGNPLCVSCRNEKDFC